MLQSGSFLDNSQPEPDLSQPLAEIVPKIIRQTKKRKLNTGCAGDLFQEESALLQKLTSYEDCNEDEAYAHYISSRLKKIKNQKDKEIVRFISQYILQVSLKYTD